MTVYLSTPTQAAKFGMFRTCDRIDDARGNPILIADARTSMCDYRVALAQALGKPCDRNGYTPCPS
jgi:hypothetical protein